MCQWAPNTYIHSIQVGIGNIIVHKSCGELSLFKCNAHNTTETYFFKKNNFYETAIKALKLRRFYKGVRI